ncbi:Fe2+ or Zn2+ uptake regulation protein [Desulfitispora alkaliphila]|uniref:Fur family transcriptional regulator n=1 Tax=Desulfitispora alkaliphila TaxID=622674 RepID=UPI003D21C20B
MKQTEKIKDIKKLIKSKGYKCTDARESIIEIFVLSNEHLKPKDVYYKTKEKEISLPTVYRNIDLLCKLGIIKEITINNHRYYELYIYSSKKLHIHFRCKKCGQIKESRDPFVIEKMYEQISYLENKYAHIVEDITIIIEGTCKDCREREMLD